MECGEYLADDMQLCINASGWGYDFVIFNVNPNCGGGKGGEEWRDWEGGRC